MKIAIGLAVSFILLFCILEADLLQEARTHYSRYRSVQKGGRHPYTAEQKSMAYFTPFIERHGWHDAPTRAQQPTGVLGKALDELKWPRTVKSVVDLYTKNTSDVGLFEWMLRPSSTILPSLQDLIFLKPNGGVIQVDADQTVAIELLNKSMVTLVTQTPHGLEESLLVDDSLFAKIKTKQAAADKK